MRLHAAIATNITIKGKSTVNVAFEVLIIKKEQFKIIEFAFALR